MTANVCRALLTVFLALCLLSGATASDEFSDALIQDVCVVCGSADGHLESCSLYVIPDIIDDSLDTDIPDIVEEPLNPEFSGDDLSSSDAVSSGDDPSSDLLTGSTEPPVQLSDTYIYFDLSAGDVTIHGNSYSGSYYDSNYNIVSISGTHDDSNKYYVYQSDQTHKPTFSENTLISVPQYDRVQSPTGPGSWGDYITNNTDVKAVITNWTTQAGKVGRTYVSSYKISVKGSGSYNITIDNIWSQKSDGLSFIPSTGGKLEINLVGDNRFENILYTSSDIRNSIIFQDSSDSNATLTVASTDGEANYWDSVIGSTDASDNAKGIKIHSGILYAGADYGDVCTAIGGGGNGYGHVTITGGTVTAVTSSSGAAIGGGIAEKSYGGEGYVEITNGTVYAYNRGYMSHYLPSGYTGGDRIFIPSSAIGGGSSSQNSGTKGTVKISGNAVVYAQSVGGTAIGGGSSASSTGGNAVVEISGNAQVTAKSVRDDVYDRYGTPFPPQPAGAAIGGGTGRTTGGSATLTVSGNAVLNTGSIGGGYGGTSTGSANVNIYGGKVFGQVMMEGDDSTFNMEGGVIDNEGATNTTFLQENGGAVWINTGEATMYGGTIKNTNAENGGAIYVSGGSFAMFGGNISSTSATANGGAIYVSGGTVSISGGNITDVSANSDGGAVYVAVTDPSVTDYSFTMSDSAVIQNAKATSGNGGAVAVANGKASMKGGSIKESTASLNGGAVSVSGGSFTMSGGTIGADDSECKAQYGGAVSVTGGTFLMNSTSKIIGGNATESGGAVYVNITVPSDGNSFTMSEYAEILKSKASVNGGAVCVEGGNALMSGGTIGGISSNGCSAERGGGVSVTGGTFTMSGSKIQNCTAVTDGGGVYVSVDDGDTTKDSFTMSEGASIENCTVSSGNGGAVSVSGGSASMIGNSVIMNSHAENGHGGAVSISNGGFIMSGGTIGAYDSECKARYGGAVSVTGGTFLMNSTSKIIGGNATESGGAVYVKVTSSEGDSFTMSDSAAILNSTASGNGGAVCVEGGSASMLSGTINSSTASGNGGAVSVSGGSFIMSGGTIGAQDAGCSAENGGAVSVTGGTFTMSNSRIQNCTATAFGGGVYVKANEGSTGDSFIITYSTIESCEGKDGGAISVSEGSVNMTSGSLLYCNATNNGGGVYVSDGNFNMTTGYLQYCNATKNGGAAYLTGGDFSMYSGAVIYNVADNNGGAVCVNNGHIVVGKDGCKGEDTTHSHPDTKYNRAGVYGGALAVSDGTVTLYCGNITDNTAEKSSDSNTIHQTGGTITVHGGTIGTGVAVIGNSQYIDRRGDVHTIYFYTCTSAQSDIVNEIKVQHPSVNASNLILNKSKIESAWTTQDRPKGKFVIGWTDDKEWEVGKSYWAEGSEVPIIKKDVDKEINYYAIWGDAEPNPHCIVVIPETLTIDEGGTGRAGIGVDTFEHIPNIGTVTVSLSNFDGKLSLPGYDDSIIYYTLSAGDKLLSSGNLKVTDFTYSSPDDVILTAEVSSTESARFSGEHSDELTFEISYSERAYSPYSY